MKTNLKRVINIILSLAMMISLVTALGSAALAAPELGITAAINDARDVITVKSALAGVEGSTFASLRVLDKDTGGYVYLNQYALSAGETPIAFPVEGVVGKVLTVIVAANAGTDSKVLVIDVSKKALEDAVLGVPKPETEPTYSERSWDVFETSLEKAKIVIADPIASQLEVNTALKDLADAEEGLELLITQLRILDIPPTYSVKRGQVIDFVAATNTGAYKGDLVWSVSNPLYATVNAATGEVKILQKTGTVILTVDDTLTGQSYSIVLRIT